MSMNPSLSVASSKVGIVRRVSVPSGPSDAELLTSLKRTLLITALETPPRFRSDIDVVMIQQHLASLGVFASVAPQILHYLATECTITRIPDGDVLFYQEDVVDDYSHAYIVLEGSLCGYFNKAFSERHSRGDDFRSWNSKKTNAKGVTIDFGDLQVTYGKGAICGIDDFYSCSLASRSRRHLKPHCRRRSVHSQESTTAIMLAKDSLDRVTERFGLVYERGALTSTKETSRTDVAHLALFSLLSETARRTLLQTASKRELKTGEILFSPDAEKYSSASAFAIVRNGCLNIHCVEYGDTTSPDLDMNASKSNTMAGNPNTKNTTSSTMSVPNGAVASLARGQTFGDQMVALGHTHIWASNPRRRRQVSMRFKVVAGDSSTEVLLITREQYEQLMREDHLRLSYTPIFGTACVPHSSALLASAIEGRDISQMTRQLLTDATLSKFFFQFPPIVLERLCHHMEIQHFESHGVLLEADCEYLVFDEKLYAQLLVEHTPAVDMSAYASPSETSVAPVAPTSAPGSVPQPTPKPATPKTDIPPNLLSYLEAAHIPWLPLSSAKKTLLLRSMRHMHLAPGQRLIKYDEVLKQLVFVVSGKLAVYVRENQEATSILSASQRSVQSVALEKSVASNYSTTSQQLYQDRDGIDGASNRKALQRKISRISEVETLDNESEVKATSPNSRFTDFVLHASKQAKTQQPSKTEGPQKVIPNPPVGTRRSLHSMVNKVKFQRMSGDSSANNVAVEKKESTKVLFMLHLCPGDIYGDEITAPSGNFRSVHDVYADTSLNGSSGANDTGNNQPRVSSSLGTEVLCLDRQVFHSILAKSEEEAASELIGRSSNAKAKWQLASKRLFKRASHSTMEETEGYIKLKKTPKLFDFFKNILNQRRFLTMGTLAHFPLLRDLSEDARRELCLNARFEALDRYTDAYKGNGDSNGTGHLFFLLLTGRIHLVTNGPNCHVVPQDANSTTPEHNLCEVGAGEGFGEFAILVPEAPAYTAAIAAEPTKLLSIPADKFLRHWPCTEDARGNIEYLRSQIPSFISLDLERIAYLYHSFSFQTHIRGTNIFQLHDTKRSSAPEREVYLIKEGTCCIRQSVTLASRPNGGYRYDPCDDECASTREDNPSPTRKTAKTIKIMATVADVGVGHVFWIDNDHDPITLVATSAAVTIASISVDKLKAIVPRGLLVGLEDLSDQLRELYAQQYQLAKRVTATVMNERLTAQSQRLPTIQPCTAQNPDKSQQPPGSVLSPCGSPHRKNVDSVTDNDLDVNTDSSMHIDTVNATYRAQRRLERYNIPSEVSVTKLVGSFLDKNQAGGDTKVIDDQPQQKSTAKQDECSSAEVTTEPIGAQQNEVSSLLRLNVKIPGAGNLKGGSPSFSSITKATTTSTEWRRPSIKSNRGMTIDIEKVISSNQENLVIYEVDVRSRVRAQMCTFESPMRAMRLEPSCTPVNSLGKYFADAPSPFSRPGESYQRQHLGLLHYLPTPPTEVRTKPQHHKPAKSFRSNAKQMQVISRSDAPSHAMLTRKQGFLTALRVKNAVSFDGDGRDILDTILPRVHQGRRFFYALVDSELREYADTIALQNLSQTPWIRRYSLHNPRRTCTVSDVPVTSGQAEALLRQSFLLNIDNATQLFFTAASAIDKLKWMTELSQACVLGGLQHPVSIKVQSTPIAATPPPGDPAALAAAVIDAFKGRRKSSVKERKRSSIFVPKPKPEDTLHVEYHIS
ncbi:hypothetical protein PF006_g8627 [Phytophthora fragariae]|uniref:Cyclic nucleotide-binding domain-containing protein n=1 Tax=Phytophthora fragariae TaxID=53985 RepID=A0A6A3L227_9STRA|nr:hypothetical protein PF011_g8379 [Phytophthora fragariae]KAE9146608.1 hypothetical protein PF006_g8627 [Phytophthora fragariae]